MSRQLVQTYKSKLLERLVLETIQSRLSVKDSMEYVTKYFHRTGVRDFTLSQSYYEKIRKSVKEKLSTEEIKPNNKLIDLSNDEEKINEIIDIYFYKIQGLVIKDGGQGGPDILHGNTDFWSQVDSNTDMLLKLINTKHKLK